MTPASPPAGRELPLVSVILPVYNGEKYLARTLDSLLGQTYPALEVIAVDDESGDRSPAILGEYREKFRGRLEVLRVPNGGVSRARNAGVVRARGFYIAFIDQDDLWIPDKVARQVESLSRSRKRIGFTNMAVIDGEGRTLSPRIRRFPEGNEVKWFEQVLFDPIVGISSVMMERSLFSEAGGFSPELRLAEDYDLLLRIFHGERPEVLDEPLLLYREHGGSSTFTRVDALIRETGDILGKWMVADPEVFRRSRLRYAKFRLKLEFLRIKAILGR